MKKKRIILIILGVIAILLVSIFMAVTYGLSEGKNVVITGIDLSNVEDGDYVGNYEHGRWTNTLTVRVRDHKIIGIGIDKNVLAAEITNCSDEVFRRVIEKQDTQIDAVSGATVTTKSYLKAIENALRK